MTKSNRLTRVFRWADPARTVLSITSAAGKAMLTLKATPGTAFEDDSYIRIDRNGAYGGSHVVASTSGATVTTTTDYTADASGGFVVQPEPPAPLSLTARGNDDVEIALVWFDATEALTSLQIQSSTTSTGPWADIAETGSVSPGDNGVDNSVTAGTYYYRLRGLNGTVAGPWSNVAVGTTCPHVTATPGNTSVALTWPLITGATSYNVYKATSEFGTYTLVQTGVLVGSKTVTGLTNGVEYWFRVTSVGPGGESTLLAGQVSATPA